MAPELPNTAVTPSAYTLFPNPTTGEFTLQHKNPDDNVTHAVLLNMAGTILEEKKTASPDIVFDLSQHSNGIYFLEIDGPTGHETWKVIKK